jgi:hypothetical protein
MGILWGNDVDYNKYYVFNGICPLLILNKNEINWLNKVWDKYIKPKNIYLDLNIKIQTKYNIVYLENDYCPICLNKKTKFEHHHCIPSSEGGSDDIVNILRICNSCHSIITNGCPEDVLPKYLTAIYHQIYLFGINFYKMNPLNNKRFKYRDMGLYENRPMFKEIINHYDNLNQEEQINFNKKIKEQALYYYKYYRSIVSNIIPSTELITILNDNSNE